MSLNNALLELRGKISTEDQRQFNRCYARLKLDTIELLKNTFSSTKPSDSIMDDYEEEVKTLNALAKKYEVEVNIPLEKEGYTLAILKWANEVINIL